MAGLWAISLGIDPRFPTFSLYSVCRPPNSTSPRSWRSKGHQGQRALQWTLRSAAWLDPRWVSLRSSVARVSWTHKRTLHCAAVAASRKHLQHSPLLSTPAYTGTLRFSSTAATAASMASTTNTFLL